TNSYTTGAPMPGIQGNVVGVLFNGEIYVVGAELPRGTIRLQPNHKHVAYHRRTANDRGHMPE
ncbi:MAG: hypothetical protein WA849_09215, partial [Candidatus Udaeobacter sp.]